MFCLKTYDIAKKILLLFQPCVCSNRLFEHMSDHKCYTHDIYYESVYVFANFVKMNRPVYMLDMKMEAAMCALPWLFILSNDIRISYLNMSVQV